MPTTASADTTGHRLGSDVSEVVVVIVSAVVGCGWVVVVNGRRVVVATVATVGGVGASVEVAVVVGMVVVAEAVVAVVVGGRVVVIGVKVVGVGGMVEVVWSSVVVAEGMVLVVEGNAVVVGRMVLVVCGNVVVVEGTVVVVCSVVVGEGMVVVVGAAVVVVEETVVGIEATVDDLTKLQPHAAWQLSSINLLLQSSLRAQYSHKAEFITFTHSSDEGIAYSSGTDAESVKAY